MDEPACADFQNQSRATKLRTMVLLNMYFRPGQIIDELISLDMAENYCAFRAADKPIKSNQSTLSSSRLSVGLTHLARNASEPAADGLNERGPV